MHILTRFLTYLYIKSSLTSFSLLTTGCYFNCKIFVLCRGTEYIRFIIDLYVGLMQSKVISSSGLLDVEVLFLNINRLPFLCVMEVRKYESGQKPHKQWGAIYFHITFIVSNKIQKIYKCRVFTWLDTNAKEYQTKGSIEIVSFIWL